MRRYIAVFLLAAVAVFGGLIAYVSLTYFPQTTQTAQQPREVTLVVITRLAPDEGEALRKIFLNSSVAREYGIKDVMFLKEDVSKWPIYAEEGRADVFFIGGYSLYKDLCEKGYLKPITDRELIEIISSLNVETYRLPNGSVCFVAAARTVFSYTINSDFLKKYGLEPPRTWGDLLLPKYSIPLLYGESIASFPKPTKSTTSARTIQMILQKYGWERGWVLLTIIGANSYIVESSERARDDVALGIAGLAPTVLVYGIRAGELSGGKAVFYPAQGEVLPDVSPVAVAKNSKNEREAIAFVKWLLSAEGQKALAELFYYLPYVKPEGTQLEGLYEALSVNMFNYDPEDAALWERAVVYYFEAAIADPDANTILKKVWSLAVDLYTKGRLNEVELLEIAHRLGAPLTISIGGESRVFSKSLAIELNKLVAEDPAFRSEFYDSVKAAAIARYSAILSELQSRT
ncbi:MAG: ABC transporter substrate-binding protein [Sulfolobales archaeon]